MVELRRKSVTSSVAKMQNPIAKAMSRAKHSSFYHDLSLRGRHPLRLLGTPKDIWPGSVTAGTQIVGGKMVAEGHILENPLNEADRWLEGDIWLATDLSEDWLDHLHSFNWLKDLNQAVDRNRAKRRAEELVLSWIDHNTQWGDVSWRSDIVGERITNWLIYTPLIMDTDDVIYRSRVLDILARSARHLMKVSSDFPDGPAGLKTIIGLIFSGLYIPFGEEWLKEGLGLLKFALGKEVLVDGGIRSRNPQELLQIFMNMVLLNDSFQGMGHKAPEELSAAISKMASNLKSLIHGDGKRALFNGTTIQSHEDIYSCLLKAGQDDVPESNMQQCGFNRLERGKTVLLQDVGPPAELELSKNCHAGALCFEMSRATERLIVNCGDASFIDDDISSRSTEAHSTLILNNHNSSEIREDGLIGRGITNITSERFEEAGHILLESEHDGYVQPYEYLHNRLLYINDSGEDIRGEDIIKHHHSSENGDTLPFAIRFHLHPNVSVTKIDGTDMLSLGLAGGEVWQFRHRGAALSIEDSIYFGDGGKASATKQIVLTSQTEGAETTTLWSLILQP
ncbi:MAG: hypothetical protein HOH18_10355 [Kordiimonadaceae bacterium]|nr:hypothetical protein [Kordiimonadaceae bacterium]MBT6036862.1 hypothetical protein [Kordiimonadaceae bacterium]